MSPFAETLNSLERALSQDARLSGAAASPNEFLTVVDFYGEPMDGDPRFRTMPHWKSSDFTGRLRRWLEAMSQQLPGSSLSEAAEALRDSPEFRGQFLVFTSLNDFAHWFADPPRTFLDAYETHYVDNGLPIFNVSPFMDGRQAKLLRKRRRK